jgi:uncharacterized protein YxeA
MKKILILILAIFGSFQYATSQNSTPAENEFITITRKKTKVTTDEKGRLLLSVSRLDMEKFNQNGFVDYESFGAKGNGKTDDIDAIAAAHFYANHYNLPVKTNDAATYYIGGTDRQVEIRTDTDFGTSTFIIDDRKVEKINEHVFLVNSTLNSVGLNGIKTLKRNQTKINATFEGTNVISVTNYKAKRYIRFGANQNSGTSQTDVFIVDKDGNVDKNTPIIWDFDQISIITALPIDETVLTIKGGKFQTIANAEGQKTSYYSRGISVKRSNVVIDGLLHTITGEGEVGAPYMGFIAISECAFVTVQNTTFTGHKTYQKIGSAGTTVSMGTYDLTANRALNISVINCKQTNDINDRTYWGLFASNFCKNILFDNCHFSRFDAHMGVANATIRNSTLGHMGINAIGEGLLLIENTKITSNRFVNLRDDYGSTWNGELIIRNCEFTPTGTNLSSVNVIVGKNEGQHEFGYVCYMPERITIENLKINDSNTSSSYNGPAIFGDFNTKKKDETYIEKFPYIVTKELILKDITTESGKPFRISDNQYMFKDLKVTTL